jgi:hypothetical protein
MSEIELEAVSKGETGFEPPQSDAIGTATRSSMFRKAHRCVYAPAQMSIKSPLIVGTTVS